jgi:hypothetical protein
MVKSDHGQIMLEGKEKVMLTLLAFGGIAFGLFLRFGHLTGVRVTLSLIGMVIMHYVFISLCFLVGLGASFIFLGADAMPDNTIPSPPSITQQWEQTIRGTRHVVDPGGCESYHNFEGVNCRPMKIEGKQGVIWPIIFIYPFSLAADLLIWMFWISLKHGNGILWLFDAFGVVMILRSWTLYLRRMVQHFEENAR